MLVRKLTEKTIGRHLRFWHQERHRARTDLVFLCREVLGYPDVSMEVHGPIIEALQKFPGAVEHHRTVEDYLGALGGRVLWEPKCRMEHLPTNPGVMTDSRETLILFPRGHLKSTVGTVAHTIQWILNYPNVRILLTTATEDLVTSFVIMLRDHFRTNDQLRQLFPELCPQAKDGKVPELGNLSGFMVPGRDNSNKKLGPGGKENTVTAATVGSAITGYHGDVLKNDDMVEKINSSSQGGIDDVIRHAGAQGDLLEKYNSDDPLRPLKGWVDFIGTPWDYSDLYQVKRTSEESRLERGLRPYTNIVVRSAAPNWNLGTDMESKGPYLWPQRMGYVALKEIEDDPTKGSAQLSAQYLMSPIVLGTGLIDDIKHLRWMDEVEITRIIPGLTLKARLDLAGMDANAKGKDNDFTALTVGGFGNGSLVIPWMRYGRPPTEEVVEWIFDVFQDFPQLTELVVEKASGASSLESWLRREMSEREKWLPVTFVTRTNQQSKQARIKGLRPWFQNGKIIFSQAMPYRTAIIAEIEGFPKFRHDDFLDTLSDLMYDARGGMDGGVSMVSVELPVEAAWSNPIAAMLAQMDREVFGEGWESSGQVDAVTGFAI